MVSAMQAGFSWPSISTVHLVGQPHAAPLHLVGRDQLGARPHPRSGRHRIGEANLVATVVDAVAHVVDVRDLVIEHRDQRQRQETVRDRFAARHVFFARSTSTWIH
jgi:hypothetical protein